MFRCEDMCLKPRSNQLDPKKRAAFNCCLPGWDVRQNTGEKLVRVRKWMGRPPDRVRGEERPPEDPANGCPAAWADSNFVRSVLRYARRRTREGGRVPNPHLDRNADELVIEAVLALEAYDDQWHAEYEDVLMSQHERDG